MKAITFIALLTVSGSLSANVTAYFACDEMRGVEMYGIYLPLEIINDEILELMTKDVLKGQPYIRYDLETIAPDRVICDPFF